MKWVKAISRVEKGGKPYMPNDPAFSVTDEEFEFLHKHNAVREVAPNAAVTHRLPEKQTVAEPEPTPEEPAEALEEEKEAEAQEAQEDATEVPDIGKPRFGWKKK